MEINNTNYLKNIEILPPTCSDANLYMLRSAENSDIVIVAKKTFKEINMFLFLNSDKKDYYTLHTKRNDYRFTNYEDFYNCFKDKTKFNILEENINLIQSLSIIDKDKVIKLFSQANKDPEHIYNYIIAICDELKIKPSNAKNMKEFFNELQSLFNKNENGKLILNHPTDKYYEKSIYDYCWRFINQYKQQIIINKENEDENYIIEH